MDTKSGERCPRCGEERLRRWHELNEEERIIVRRLPETSEYSASEREAMHRWCTRCWLEETQAQSRDV